MTDRERLIKLVNKAKEEYANDVTDHTETDYIVESLLNNGVIIPPCKVGDTVYIPWTWDGQQGIGFAEVEEIKIYDNKNHIMFFIDLESDDEEFEQQYGGWKLDKSIGDTVFLTKEEAEEKLKELDSE